MTKKESNAAWAKRNPEKRKQLGRDHTLRKYGLTQEGYERLLMEQGGVCAICGEAPEGRHLSVDHDHESGKVRGLLCHYCNPGLGNFKDSIPRLHLAAAYLRRAQE